MIITRENVFDYVSKTVNKFTGAETFTSADGRFQIIANKCTSEHGPHDVMTIWKKAGYIKKELDTFIAVDAYYTDENNRCKSIYNATVKRDPKTHTSLINFDYLKEWTEENIILLECMMRFLLKTILINYLLSTIRLAITHLKDLKLIRMN